MKIDFIDNSTEHHFIQCAGFILLLYILIICVLRSDGDYYTMRGIPREYMGAME